MLLELGCAYKVQSAELGIRYRHLAAGEGMRARALALPCSDPGSAAPEIISGAPHLRGNEDHIHQDQQATAYASRSTPSVLALGGQLRADGCCGSGQTRSPRRSPAKCDSLDDKC
jgi:hypothetical protein